MYIISFLESPLNRLRLKQAAVFLGVFVLSITLTTINKIMYDPKSHVLPLLGTFVNFSLVSVFVRWGLKKFHARQNHRGYRRTPNGNVAGAHSRTNLDAVKVYGKSTGASTRASASSSPKGYKRLEEGNGSRRDSQDSSDSVSQLGKDGIHSIPFATDLATGASDMSGGSGDIATQEGQMQISQEIFIKWILPLGVLTALDIGLSNYAMSRLPLSLITVIKSGNVVLIYLFGVLFGNEYPDTKILFVCVFIACSVSIGAPFGSSLQTDPGAVLVLIVSVLSMSLRWVIVQRITNNLVEPTRLIAISQPVCALAILPFSFAFEIVPFMQSFDVSIISVSGVLRMVGLLSVAAVCATMLMLLEYIAVKLTSSLSLCVNGVLKEVTVLMLSVGIFHESISTRQAVAIALSLCGLITYTTLRTHSIHQ